MTFAHDTKTALLAAAAVVNTLPGASDSGEDELADTAALADLVVAHEYSGTLRGDVRELDEVRAIRTRLRRVWAVDRDGAAMLANDLLREFDALPQLVRHDDWDWHIHAIAADRPLAERMAVETAIAVVDLVRAEELSRLRECAADDCDAVLVDLSRNRSKRYCDVGNCANRAHVAAYRSRQADGS